MTIRATAPISAILDRPISIMDQAQSVRVPAETARSALLLGFDIDGGLVGRRVVGNLACGWGGGGCRVGRTVFHAVLEALDGAPGIGEHVLGLLGAEHQDRK